MRTRIPSLSAYVEICYGAESNLRFEDHSILSCCGVQQGDPLCPLCFSLALHSLVKWIQEQVPDHLINAWYLDDGTLCGTARDLSSALAIIEEHGTSHSLHLNWTKSPLHILEGSTPTSNPLPLDIPPLRSDLSYWIPPLGLHPFVSQEILAR